MPTDVPLIGDVGATLTALLPLLEFRADRNHLAKYQEKMRHWRARMATLRKPDREPIAPQYLAGLLDELATDDAILTCDSGTVATWAARHWTIRGGREFYLSGNLATMAPAVPYAIAMQHAYPDRQVIAYLGDGSFAMLMAEAHRRLAPPHQGGSEQQQQLGADPLGADGPGHPEHGVRYGGPPDYAAWARGCGAYGIHIDRPSDLPGALRRRCI